MPILTFSSRLPLCGWPILAGVLAVSFHLLTTIDLLGTSLRAGASDLLLPPLLLWAAVSLQPGMMTSLLARLRGLWLWMAALSGSVLLALIIGRLHMGEWSSWALVNKSVGWVLLLGYTVLGVCVVTAGGNTAVRAFLRFFLVAGWIGSALSLLAFLAFHFNLLDTLKIEGGYHRLRGAFDNPNAFGFALVIGLLAQTSHHGTSRLFPWPVDLLGKAILWIGIFYSGSRSAWLGAAAGFAALAILRGFSFRDLVIEIGLAFLLERLSYYLFYGGVLFWHRGGISGLFWHWGDVGGHPDSSTMPDWGVTGSYVFREAVVQDSGFAHRVLISQQAVESWLSSPILGIGLGSFFWEQLRHGQAVPAAIHTSALWVLTEMGLVGLILFSAFFVWVLTSAWPTARRPGFPLSTALFAIILATAAASIGLEILYQRYLWFILGLAMASQVFQASPTAKEGASPA